MGTETTVVLVDGQSRPRLIPSTRFTLALLVFFAFIVQYSQRVNLPIAIVCMVNRTKPTQHYLSFDVTTALPNDILETASHSSVTTKPTNILMQKGGIFQEKQYYWSELQQQLLLGGYWAGYIFTQIPGGWFATNIGVKWVYAGSLGTSSLATLALTIMYMMSNTHFILAFVLRCIIGLAHGVLFPATVSLWSLWAVPQERSTLASIGFCGTHLGTSLTMLFGGLLCRYVYSGWMYLFVITSILGFLWLILWIALTADSPQQHKRISNHERDYICRLTGSTGKKRMMSLASLPWKNIIKSKPVNALIITHIANLFGLFFFLTNLGKISNELLRIPPQSTGYLLCSGFFLTLLCSLSSGIVADHLVRANKITLTNARRLFNSLASFIPVLCMISFYFCDNSRQMLGIITILVYLASSGFAYGSGFVVNFADVVPAFSGVIFGVANTFASLAGLIGNIVAGLIIKKPVLEQWRKLYIMFGIVYFIGGLVYVIYGSAIPRKWATFQAVNNSAKQEQKLDAEEAIPMNANVQANKSIE
ncbi:unnamed protein product [Rotaria sp. Silwood1]|nr:unnamed protein product [Rotaria sp. Silwood1]CAF3328539.1 unnamed protein product [Rotaria sp. Silwood1]CAF3351865.1 unnamed protein product [Rotaria sp. Silwood1]CAF4603796.1 unnamed protein product [Rotaria sp. Silwood1]CAF4939285.1 unnamed protein product [Rotaria sp. Silwood1]